MALDPRLGGGIALILFSLVLIALGAFTLTWCSGPTPAGVTVSCGPGTGAVLAVGILVLLVGIGLVAGSFLGRRPTLYPTTDPAVPPPIIRPVLIQQTIVQPTVEVRCRYCGTLNPVSSARCTSCGAAL